MKTENYTGKGGVGGGIGEARSAGIVFDRCRQHPRNPVAAPFTSPAQTMEFPVFVP